MEAPKLFSVMWVLTQFYTKIRLHIFRDVGKDGKGWKRVAGGGGGDRFHRDLNSGQSGVLTALMPQRCYLKNGDTVKFVSPSLIYFTQQLVSLHKSLALLY